jgi:hypothetical protein
MSDEITAAELEKAARNIGRIADYLAARRDWDLPASTEEAVGAIRDAADSFAEYLNAIMTARQVPVASEMRPPTDPLTAAELDTARLEKFSVFLNQLRQWFSRRGEADLPTGAGDQLQEIQAALATTSWAADALLTTNEVRRAAAASERGEYGEVVEVDREARLVLEHTDSTPLIQEFKGVVELTPDAKQLLQEFYEKHDLDHGPLEKRRLRDKVVRWIESTPEGQVLVLKISGLHGRPELYSTYQSRAGHIDDLIGDLTDDPVPEEAPDGN